MDMRPDPQAIFICLLILDFFFELVSGNASSTKCVLSSYFVSFFALAFALVVFDIPR